MKNNLENEDCLDEEEVVPVVPISNRNVDQHTLKTVVKNNLENEDCLDEEEVVPVVTISNRNVDTVAGSKLVYREEEKRKSIRLEVCETTMTTMLLPVMYMQYKVIMLLS